MDLADKVPLGKHREPRGKERKSNRHTDAT